MFHHFHGQEHPAGQGSISAGEFREMIGWLRSNYRVLGAHDFLELALAGSLSDLDTCLTFDDSLRCQFDIAAPVLDDEGLTGFFFVYSSAFSDQPDMLEIYRYFRSTEFSHFDDFCEEFMEQSRSLYRKLVNDALRSFVADSYLAEFPFYSTNDRLFRYVRDRVLSADQYAEVMSTLMKKHGFDVESVLPLLFMSPDHLVELQSRGNIIGLHSNSHPLDMGELDSEAQRQEYLANLQFLERVLQVRPVSMSHPMGRYNETTLDILRTLGVQLGFRSNLGVRHINDLLEVPRMDHAVVQKMMRS